MENEKLKNSNSKSKNVQEEIAQLSQEELRDFRICQGLLSMQLRSLFLPKSNRFLLREKDTQ